LSDEAKASAALARAYFLDANFNAEASKRGLLLAENGLNASINGTKLAS